MAIKTRNQNIKASLPAGRQGFALLVAVIFMSVMLALGIGLSSLSYKQQLLASTAIESQYAFYAADAGMECSLYDDQQQNAFDYDSHDCGSNQPAPTTCDGTPAVHWTCSKDSSRLSFSQRLSLDSGKHCADVTIYKTINNPGGWTFCAAENGTCSFTGTKIVRYGDYTHNIWTSGALYTNSVHCNNSTFGDPDPGTIKECDYSTPSNGTYIYSQGYDVPCSTVDNPPQGARFVSRGMRISY